MYASHMSEREEHSSTSFVIDFTTLRENSHAFLPDPTRIVTEEEIVNTSLHSQARELLDKVIYITPDALANKTTSGGGRMLPGGVILSKTWHVKGNSLFASQNTDEGYLRAVIDTRFPSHDELGNNNISLKDYYLRETFPPETLPDGFPDVASPDTIMLKVYLHTDEATREQVQNQLTPGFFEDPSQFKDHLFTTYFLQEGKLGKFVYLPSTVQDNRISVSPPTEWGRAIALPTTAADRDLVQRSLDQIRNDLSPLDEDELLLTSPSN